ncbi:TetR/AcrR family transcriptional regulator [Bordetella genomosp. 11]|uniref:TetR family transcriptional regulator n=1 Tax=Bordetella genomosp. 11 TaxID=1416808 RepID=A0A261UZJ7_9BORD|nr:TetR/AcrR family transcriptional regulator [Bordetella genomosp. 11]OZI66772.1 TetR family transcriptional regulator [Bordetella genomosp. 11]
MEQLSSTAEEILACTRALIIAGGYKSFSYADVAEVVGIRKASIHHHFPSKVDLVRVLLARYREEAQTGVAALERNVADPFDQLTNYVGYWEACIEEGTASFCIGALLASELPVLPEEVAVEVRAHFRFLASWLQSVLERGKQQGRIHLMAAPRAEAESFLATVHGAMLSARAYGDPKMFGVITKPLLDRLAVRH